MNEKYRNRAYKWLMSEDNISVQLKHIPNAVESLMALLAEVSGDSVSTGEQQISDRALPPAATVQQGLSKEKSAASGEANPSSKGVEPQDPERISGDGGERPALVPCPVVNPKTGLGCMFAAGHPPGCITGALPGGWDEAMAGAGFDRNADHNEALVDHNDPRTSGPMPTCNGYCDREHPCAVCRARTNEATSYAFTPDYRSGWEDGLDRAACELRVRRMFDADSVVSAVPREPGPWSGQAPEDGPRSNEAKVPSPEDEAEALEKESTDT